MALDPSYFFYSEGTITLTNGSDVATGQFTAWDPAVLPFDFVFPNNGTAGMTVIKEVIGMNSAVLAKPWTGPTLTNVPYFMVRWTRHTDPRVYAVRVSDYLARLKAIPENLDEVAEQINADRQAVEAALILMQQVMADVDADRQAVDAKADQVETARQQVAANVNLSAAWAQTPEDTDVSGPGTRSARHFAAKAQKALDDVLQGIVPNNSVSTAKIVDGAVTTAKLAGGSVTNQKIAGDAVDNTQMANMATGRVKGRLSSGTGDPEDLTAVQLGVLLGRVGMVEDFMGSALPAGYLWPDGRNVSRTTYALLFSVLGTTYGAGDGTTTFTLPDLRGRVTAGRDDMGGNTAGRLSSTSGVTGTTLGAVGGDQRMQSHAHNAFNNVNFLTSPGGGPGFAGGSNYTSSNNPTTTAVSGAGGSQNVQPTLVLNKILFAGV